MKSLMFLITSMGVKIFGVINFHDVKDRTIFYRSVVKLNSVYPLSTFQRWLNAVKTRNVPLERGVVIL
jgi:hypothetical protein